jgi:hypothetical protein
VVAIMQSTYASLKERGLLRWTLIEIPTHYEEPFITIVAYKAANDFGGLTTELVELHGTAMRELFALNERKADPRTSRVVDY